VRCIRGDQPLAQEKGAEMTGMTTSKRSSGTAVAAVVAAATVAAVAAWFANASAVRAPEPARLNATLSSTSVSGLYITSLKATNVYFLSNTNWTARDLPSGAPCSATWGLSTGATVYGVVMAAGNYRKCSA
jgi:hypothetical protein